MTSAVLIPGAGGLGWYWHLVERHLEDQGYDALTVDLAASGRAGLPAYADAVVNAIGGRADVALIAQSMGAFTVPLVWQRVPISVVVFVNAMIPRPGETPGQWWDNVGSEQARTAAAVRHGYSTEFDLTTYFMHDVRAQPSRGVGWRHRRIPGVPRLHDPLNPARPMLTVRRAPCAAPRAREGARSRP